MKKRIINTSLPFFNLGVTTKQALEALVDNDSTLIDIDPTIAVDNAKFGFPYTVKTLLSDDSRDFIVLLKNRLAPEDFTIVTFIEMAGKEVDSRGFKCIVGYVRVHEKAHYFIAKGFKYSERLSEEEELREYLEKEEKKLSTFKNKNVPLSLSLKHSLAEKALSLLVASKK